MGEVEGGRPETVGAVGPPCGVRRQRAVVGPNQRRLAVSNAVTRCSVAGEGVDVGLGGAVSGWY